MAKFVRKFSKRIFIVSNIVLVILFLLGCLNIYLDPESWWFAAVLGLAFPFLLVLMIGFVLLWAIFRSKWIILPLAGLLLGFTNIRALIAINFNSSFKNQKDSGTIRILTWNVMWFDEQTKIDKREKSKRKEMLEFIKAQDADVLCFQEFLEGNKDKKGTLRNIEEVKKLGYPYYYWSKDYDLGKYYAGAAIFSRFPIVDTIYVDYNIVQAVRAAESLIGADLNVNGKLIRVYTTHLESNQLRKNDYRNLEIIRNAEDSMMEASKSILRKLTAAYKSRKNQADIARTELDKSPYPVIICGDFNDVPNSYTYFKIKGGRQDAFIQKGNGIGRTYSNISPTLRIDYILPDKAFKVLQAKRIVLPYSDHYPVIADLRFDPK